MGHRVTCHVISYWGGGGGIMSQDTASKLTMHITSLTRCVMNVFSFSICDKCFIPIGPIPLLTICKTVTWVLLCEKKTQMFIP